MLFLPPRLNLAIARRCFVSCPGCYTNFGRSEPDLTKLLGSVSRFFSFGVRDITISGGDPLTIRHLLSFLDDLRRAGARSIKLDTVGTYLTQSPENDTAETDHFVVGADLPLLLKRLDYLGIPLDGWSNEHVRLFRAGRTRLHDETLNLLAAIDLIATCPLVIINTVAHALNLAGLSLIGDEMLGHMSVCHWNVFQYSPTDQVSHETNSHYEVSDTIFQAAEQQWRRSPASLSATAKGVTVEFRSVRSRLGQYLLINSDGVAWIPDEGGRTVSLGTVFEREEKILDAWREVVIRLWTLRDAPVHRSI